ncbi:MAG: hypothetical protein HYV63_19950 [Candidatus Schekmanbacteria bacterium]|nr:hypothetical protein [Candidatus Schekmanbacteria bacterium]
MGNGESKWLIAIVCVLCVLSLSQLMNTCAIDRLERQVIRVARALEAQSGGGGRMRSPVATGAAGAAAANQPGASTGIEVTGWGGRKAEILHVEGAVPNPPFLLADKPKPQNDTYVNRRISPPGSLNTYATNESDTDQIAKNVLGGLVMSDPDRPSEVQPALATRWEVSEDKLKYTYHLRKGAQFADGRPFTAADVLFSFAVVRDPEVNAEHLRSKFDDVEEMLAPDPQTVVVKYRRRYWKGLYSVGYNLRILNKGWYEEQLPKWAERLGITEHAIEPGKPGFGKVFNKISVPCPGTGPYYFAADRYLPETFVELVQNPFYYGIQVKPDWYNFSRLRWVFIADAVAAFEEFRKQRFDITVVDKNSWDDEYSKDPTITSIANYYQYDHTGLGYSYIQWNCRHAPFDDARVRRAMTHLTNRQWILDEVERGGGTVAAFPWKRIYATYSNDIAPLAFDIEAARALLAEAGWKDSDGDGVLDRDGKRFELELKVGSTRRFFQQVGAVLKDACDKVGIRMTLRTLEWSTFIQDFYERRFDAACLYASPEDPWMDNYDEYHSSQDVPRGGNSGGWHHGRADELLEAMRVEFDADKRAEMAHDFNRIFAAEQPQTLLLHTLVSVLQHKRIRDGKVRPSGLQFFDVWVDPQDVLYK